MDTLEHTSRNTFRGPWNTKELTGTPRNCKKHQGTRPIETPLEHQGTHRNTYTMRFQDLEFYVDGVILTSVSVFGLIGTLLSIRVLLKPNLRNSFSNLLVGLAICDANFLTCAILIIGLPKAWAW